MQDKCHPQTISVLQSRASGLGLTVEVGDEKSFTIDKDVSGVLLQYPATDGSVHDYKVSVSLLQGRLALPGCLASISSAWWWHSCCWLQSRPT